MSAAVSEKTFVGCDTFAVTIGQPLECGAPRTVINITKAQPAPPELQGNNPMRTALILGIFMTCLATPAMAQGQTTFAVNGTVNTFDATSISVKNDDGGAVETFQLSPNLLVVQTTPATLSDIKPNDLSPPPPCARKTASCIRPNCASSPMPCAASGRAAADERRAQSDDDQCHRHRHGDRRR